MYLRNTQLIVTLSAGRNCHYNIREHRSVERSVATMKSAGIIVTFLSLSHRVHFNLSVFLLLFIDHRFTSEELCF